MPLTIDDVNLLQEYIKGVMARADHHAGNVNGIALALVGAIVWRKDDNSEISVMAKEGETKNVLWVKFSGNRYAFSYNHESGEIEMRESSLRGALLHSFSNRTSTTDLKAIFENL